MDRKTVVIRLPRARQQYIIIFNIIILLSSLLSEPILTAFSPIDRYIETEMELYIWTFTELNWTGLD